MVAPGACQDIAVIVNVVVAEFFLMMRQVDRRTGGGDADHAHDAGGSGAVTAGALGLEGGYAAVAVGGLAGLGLGLGVGLTGEKAGRAEEQKDVGVEGLGVGPVGLAAGSAGMVDKGLRLGAGGGLGSLGWAPLS